MKTRKIAGHTEYYQDIKYSCGDVVTTITLDYKVKKHEIERLKKLKCPTCRHRELLMEDC